MANPEHMAVVRQGKEAIAQWRRSHRLLRLDLTDADLTGADLSGLDLSYIDFANVSGGGVDLAGATLNDANLRNAWLLGAQLIGANLIRADLSEAQLWSAQLSGADLRGAQLIAADLREADLSEADLSEADLSQAKLGNANLGGARLFGAKLILANLREADLFGAELIGANLTGALVNGLTLSQARVGVTYLAEIDLSQVIGLTTVKHIFPSSVGVDTLMASVRGAGNKLTDDLMTFFRGAGVPQELLDMLPRIAAEVEHYTCFIAYGKPDVTLAQKLSDDLKARGVSCWLYDMDATVGKRTWAEIGRKRREAEKTVVLCSAKALVRDGVLKEIEEQIDEDPDKIVPISLDDLWKEPGFKVVQGTRDLKPFLLERNYADFANSDYDEAFEQLLKGLRRESERKGEK